MQLWLSRVCWWIQNEAETAKQFCQKVVDSENEYQVSVGFILLGSYWWFIDIFSCSLADWSLCFDRIIIFFKLQDKVPCVFQKLEKAGVWNDHQSGWSSVQKLSCNKTLLDHCMTTETHYYYHYLLLFIASSVAISFHFTLAMRHMKVRIPCTMVLLWISSSAVLHSVLPVDYILPEVNCRKACDISVVRNISCCIFCLFCK